MLIANLTFFADDGHMRFRVHGPAAAMARKDGVTVVDCDMYSPWADWLLDEADVLVLHGVNSEWLPVIHDRRNRGRATTFDVSDDLLDVQPWRDYSAGWLDRSLQDLFWQTVAAVDAVQTSTPALAARWAGRARRVLTFPNAVSAPPPLADPPVRQLTVGWAGSGTHLADWAAVAPQVQDWTAGRPDARLAIMTDPRAATFVRLSAGRYEFRPSGKLADYTAFLRELDIGFVPPLPGRFNAGRTDLKFVDYASAGVAGVYPRAGPYAVGVADGATGLLYEDVADLCAALSRLANDTELRLSIRTAAHAEIVRRAAADVADRSAVYAGLLAEPPPARPLPDRLVAAAVRDGRYFRLPPGDYERTLSAATRAGPSAETASVLTDLVGRHPGHRTAERHRARVLNDLGLHSDALTAAERLAARPPDSPGTRIELARALIGLGRSADAVHHLERAVVLNPLHAVAWQLLREHARPEDAAATARLWARNCPLQYMPALARVAVLPPAEGLDVFAESIARYAPTAHPDEDPYAAAAFGTAAAALSDACPPADLEPVLAAAVAAFPDSARLAGLRGDCLYRMGRTTDADREYGRAARLNRVRLTSELDAGAWEPPVWRWQIAEYTARADMPGGDQ